MNEKFCDNERLFTTIYVMFSSIKPVWMIEEYNINRILIKEMPDKIIEKMMNLYRFELVDIVLLLGILNGRFYSDMKAIVNDSINEID